MIDLTSFFLPQTAPEYVDAASGSGVVPSRRRRALQLLPYIGIPLLCAALPVARAGRTGLLFLLRDEFLIMFSYIAAVSDLKTMRISNSIITVILASWALLTLPLAFVNVETLVAALIDSAAGLFMGGGLFLLVYFISKKELGGGDVKFMAVSGLCLGWGKTLSAMLLGTVLTGLTGAVLILMKKISVKDYMPLIPFLFIGILISVFLL